MNQSKLLAYGIALSTGLLLAGCGSSSDPDDTTLTGNLEVAVTDAEEDFLSYRIELESIQLKKTNGTLVEVLPLQSDIDFVQYQELSELFAVLSVPAGEYQSVVLGLDYTDADIVIQDEEGASYQANIQDSSGNSLSQIDVELNLNDNESIHISPFKTAQLTLDLDLAASNTIESFDPPLVTVEPFMVGSTSLDMDREHRVRGLLESVDIEAKTVALNLIPMRLRKGAFGNYDLHVDDNTLYEINGVEYTAEEGLTLLAEQAEDTPLIAFGGPSEDEEIRYLATQLLIGSSVPWAEQDVLKGIITARTDNTISIQGAVVETVAKTDETVTEGSTSNTSMKSNKAKAAHFLSDLTLTTSDDTVVTGYRLGDADVSKLSVGQRVLALGEFNTDTKEFDSSAGHVRMKLNAIVGEVVQVSPLELDLSHINKRPIDLFDFSGTGIDAEQDADPAQYDINSSTLDLSTTEVDEWMQVRGYPSAFGSSPTDFDALSIVNPDFSSHPARMFALWQQPTTTGVSIESGEMILDLDNAKSKLHLKGVPGSSKLGISVSKLNSSTETGRFSLLIRGEGIHVFSDFDSFTSSVNGYLQEGLAIHQLTATGQYSDSSNALDADYVTLRLASTSLINTEE